MKISQKRVFLGAAIIALSAMFLVTQSPKAQDSMQKEDIEKIVREYLVSNPEVVIDAIEAFQANQEVIEKRKFEQTLADNKEELFGADLPFTGNPDGDVVIVEFFDYNCGYCKRAMVDVNKVLEKDKNVKVIFMEMPILSEASNLAARYSLASHNQGKYFEYHQAIMTMSGGKTKSNLEKVAKDLGLDIDKLRKDAESKEIRQKIEKGASLSRKLGIRGTPAFIINDVFAPGYMTYQNMLEVIKQVRNGKG